MQLLLANLLPLLFDGLRAPLPPLLRPVFVPERLFEGESIYVVDGVVTWGYVLPFFLSNFLANIYGYFMNMKATFRGHGTRAGLIAYLLVLTGPWPGPSPRSAPAWCRWRCSSRWKNSCSSAKKRSAEDALTPQNPLRAAMRMRAAKRSAHPLYSCTIFRNCLFNSY